MVLLMVMMVLILIMMMMMMTLRRLLLMMLMMMLMMMMMMTGSALNLSGSLLSLGMLMASLASQYSRFDGMASHCSDHGLDTEAPLVRLVALLFADSSAFSSGSHCVCVCVCVYMSCFLFALVQCKFCEEPEK